MADNKSLLIHDSADKTPPIPSRPPHHIISGSDFARPSRRSLDWPWHLSAALAVVLLVVIGLVAWWLIGALRSWAWSHPWLAENAPALIVGTLLLIGLYWLAGSAYWSIARRRFDAYLSGLARTRLGTPVAADVVASASWQMVMAAEAAASTLELGRAPFTRYPLLSTLSEGNKENAETTIYGGAGSDDDDDAPSGRVPPSTWLGWVDETPHLMIAGRTAAGKTTLASAILAERIQAGDTVLVIDPHDQPDKWFGIAAIGGGRQFESILATLEAVVREMDQRYQAYNAGASTDSFQRLTVLVDEVPAIMDSCLNPQRRLIDARWSLFARKLGSEARKVRISVVLLTQSVLVQDIGINTAMRKNFSRIALGDEVRKLIREEGDNERRSELSELLRGAEYMAMMEHLGELHVLDTSDVPTLAKQRWGQATVWRAPTMPYAMPANTPEVPRTNGIVHSYEHSRVNGQTPLHALDSAARDELIRSLFRAGRDYAYIESLRKRGLRFDQKELPRLRQEALGELCV